MASRLGAYVLPGDPVWLEETLRQYYPLLDDLVVPVPDGGIGWAGRPLPVDECLAIIRRVDSRGVARVIHGSWVEPQSPMKGDTAQRQAALDALAGTVDWALQLDSDEFLPRPAVIAELIALADAHGADAVELPMRVLFRRTARHVFEITAADGAPHHEYPGAVLVRPTVRLADARRVEGRFVRVVCDEASGSLQLSRAPEPHEARAGGFDPADVIIHNSWARTPSEVRQKVASWGHAKDVHPGLYYWLRWWPAPALWWATRDFHPFSRGLWPRLRRIRNEGVVADSPRP